MKKAIIVLLFLILFGCSPKATLTTEPADSTAPMTYVVTRETGLYATAKSGNYFSTLLIGTKVKPANNAFYLDCDIVETYDVKITTCNVEVISTGKTGWVLKNALKLLD